MVSDPYLCEHDRHLLRLAEVREELVEFEQSLVRLEVVGTRFYLVVVVGVSSRESGWDDSTHSDLGDSHQPFCWAKSGQNKEMKHGWRGARFTRLG